jgi:hypothetical protein
LQGRHVGGAHFFLKFFLPSLARRLVAGAVGAGSGDGERHEARAAAVFGGHVHPEFHAGARGNEHLLVGPLLGLWLCAGREAEPWHFSRRGEGWAGDDAVGVAQAEAAHFQTDLPGGYVCALAALGISKLDGEGVLRKQWGAGAEHCTAEK